MADTMLATGASLILALKTLLAEGVPSQLHIVCAIASAEGIKQLETSFPDAHIWVGVIDPELSVFKIT
jgi:uracil phosphoribosyltransferase